MGLAKEIKEKDLTIKKLQCAIDKLVEAHKTTCSGLRDLQQRLAQMQQVLSELDELEKEFEDGKST